MNAPFDLNRAILDHMHHGVCLFDSDGKVISMNRRFIEMYSFEQLSDRTLLDMIRETLAKTNTASVDAQALTENLLEAIKEGKTRQQFAEFGDGTIMSITHRPIGDGHWFSIHEDVTDRVRAEREIAHLARHDSLTGLANRAAFHDELEKVLAEVATKREQLAIFYIDLDRFKEINDLQGHHVGDEYLKEIARRLSGAAGDAFVARLGGDELALIQRAPQPMGATALAGRIQAVIGRELVLGQRTLHPTLSVGIAIYPDDGTAPDVLIDHADAAMYRAKAAGRNGVRFFDPQLDEGARAVRVLESEMKGVVARNELILHYQPLATPDGEISGFEALVRWQHPKRGLLMPGSFIQLAEQNGCIMDIGEWVLREACREAATWENPLSISVNLSSVQFRHRNLPSMIAGILEETGLDPERLELELTETVLLENMAQSINTLEEIKKLGVKVALDDFGTGFASLSYLRTFAFDRIKIDRSFTSDIPKGGAAEAIIRGVIGLARGLDLPVTAEGVETAEQLSFLTRESCNQMQGYFIGRPGPIKNYAVVLSEIGSKKVA